MALSGSLHAQPLRVVTESATYTYLKDGKVAGSATEVVEACLQRAGFGPYEIELVPWARAYDTARTHPDVLIYLIARSPEREAQFRWVREVVRIQSGLYKLRDRKDIVLEKLDDAKAYTVATVRDDVRHQYLRAHGFTRLVLSAQGSDNLAQLLKRKVDLVPLPQAALPLMCKPFGAECDQLELAYGMDDMTTRLYMAFSLGTPQAWVDRLGTAFDQLRAEGVVRRILDKGP